MQRSWMIVVLVSALWCSGCSFAFVEQAPTGWDREQYESCTDGKALPAMDLNLTLGFASGTIGAIVTTSSQPSSSSSGGNSTASAIGLLGGALGLISGVSSGYGFVQTAECREYQEAVLSQPSSSSSRASRRRTTTEPSNETSSESSETTSPSPSEIDSSSSNATSESFSSVASCRTDTICSSDDQCLSGDLCVGNRCLKRSCLERIGRSRGHHVQQSARDMAQ